MTEVEKYSWKLKKKNARKENLSLCTEESNAQHMFLRFDDKEEDRVESM
jgi:hypothetical protein